jgi:hypothetical protein
MSQTELVLPLNITSEPSLASPKSNSHPGCNTPEATPTTKQLSIIEAMPFYIKGK